VVEAPKALAATLILTDRRAVVLVSPEPSKLPWPLGGAIGTLIAELFDSEKEPRLSHQIRRDRFASVEQGEKDLIVFHDQGEGYGHTSFAITSRESFADWQHRM